MALTATVCLVVVLSTGALSDCYWSLSSVGRDTDSNIQVSLTYTLCLEKTVPLYFWLVNFQNSFTDRFSTKLQAQR